MSASGGTLTAQQIAIINAFNGKLKLLMADLAGRVPGDAVVARAQKRLLLASDGCPIDVFTIAGQALLKYWEVIFSDDDRERQKFFQGGASAFQSDLDVAEDATKRDAAEHIIPKIQEIALKSDKGTQDKYLDEVRELLDMYGEYLDLG